MENDNENLVKVSDCEIEFFDDDPDGEPDRAGDGYYFRIPGEDSWSGPWHSEEEAEDELKEQLESNEDAAIQKIFEEEGWLLVPDDRDDDYYLNKIDNRWFSISVGEENVVLSERTPGSCDNYPIRAMAPIQQVEDCYGHRAQAVKGTLGFLKEALEVEVPALKM